MKRLFYALLLLVCVSQLSAQTKEKGFYIDVNGGYGQKDAASIQHGLHREGYGMVTPGLGYQFNSRWAVGFRTTLQLGDNGDYTMFSPYVRFAFFQYQNLKLFSEAMFQYIEGKGDSKDHPDYSNIEAGFTVGASYSLTKHLGVNLRYLFLGYSDYRDSNNGAVWGDEQLILDGGPRRLSLGLQYTF